VAPIFAGRMSACDQQARERVRQSQRQSNGLGSSQQKTVFLGWCDSKVPIGLPVSFTSALIQRGGSCPPLTLVELIQKVSTKSRSGKK
jgi:hypothetical protein